MKKTAKKLVLAAFAASAFLAACGEVDSGFGSSIPADFRGAWNEVGGSNQLEIGEFSVTSIVRMPVVSAVGEEIGFIEESRQTYHVVSVIRGRVAANPELYGYTISFGRRRGMTSVHINGGELVIPGAGGGIHNSPFTVRAGVYEP